MNEYYKVMNDIQRKYCCGFIIHLEILASLLVRRKNLAKIIRT